MWLLPSLGPCQPRRKTDRQCPFVAEDHHDAYLILQVFLNSGERPRSLGPDFARRRSGVRIPSARRQNEVALRTGERLFSYHDTPAGKVCVITEADRSLTTILLPEEY